MPSSLSVPICVSTSLHLIPPTVSQALFSGVYLPVPVPMFSIPILAWSSVTRLPILILVSDLILNGSYSSTSLPHQTPVLLLGSFDLSRRARAKREGSRVGQAGTLTESSRMPERLSDAEGLDRDFLGSKDLKVEDLLPRFCSSVARVQDEGMWE